MVFRTRSLPARAENILHKHKKRKLCKSSAHSGTASVAAHPQKAGKWRTLQLYTLLNSRRNMHFTLKEFKHLFLGEKGSKMSSYSFSFRIYLVAVPHKESSEARLALQSVHRAIPPASSTARSWQRSFVYS